MANQETMDKMEGVEMGSEELIDSMDDGGFTPLRLSKLEQQILDLYDRMQDMQLEISLLQVSESIPVPKESEVTDGDIQAAKEELLETKALYTLRSNIVESVLVSNPILKAVHAGVNATPIERDLLPLIQERDNLAISLTQLSSKILKNTELLTNLEAEHVITARKNTGLAAEMIALAEEANEQKKGDVKDPILREELEELEAELKTSRQRWRIMKETTSAVVVGSGVDWARDPSLRQLVLDVDSEEDD